MQQTLKFGIKLEKRLRQQRESFIHSLSTHVFGNSHEDSGGITEEKQIGGLPLVVCNAKRKELTLYSFAA